MKPLSLTIEGFRSHENETTFDLADRTLIAIVGPTGAGKSSILDAIAYALYGKTPRMKRGTKRLICSRSDTAHVQLRFSVEGREFEVTRALPRKGTGEHVLVDLSSSDRVIGEGRVEERVKELLGLDFDAFCSSVLLAQGMFSEFLDATTTARMRILKGIFRYDQIDSLRDVAKQKIVAIENELSKIEGERRQIPDDAKALAHEARGLAKNERDKAVRLEKAVPEEKALQVRVAELSTEAKEATKKLEEARRDHTKLPRLEDIEALGAEEAGVVKSLDEAAAALVSLDSEIAAAKDALASLEKDLGERDRLIEARASVKSIAERAEEIDGTVKEVVAMRERLGELAARLEAAQAAEAAANVARDDAAAALEDLRRMHQAHALRAGLAPGDPCPVCERELDVVPRGKAPGALTKAESECAKATKGARAAADERVSLSGKVSSSIEGIDRRDAEIEKRRAKLEELRAEVEAVVGRVDDPAAEIAGRLERLSAASKAVGSAVARRDDATKTKESCVAAEAEFAKKRRKVGTVLIELAPRYGVTAPDLEAGASALGERVDEMRAALDTAVANHTSTLEKLEVQSAEVTTHISQLRTSLELAADRSIEVALGESVQLAAKLDEQAAQLEAKLARAKELDAEEKSLTKRRAIYDRLAKDLTERNFINFLLEDRRRLLSEIGSERLRAMTGRYRFDDDGEFNIVDEFDAEKERESGTLSGGESFLASLALALGLAETVARHGGRLQSFFLDEGFGSLDAESLDLALDGIERVVGPDRLIGLVSHVDAMRARIEDQIVLEKTAEGTSRVVSGAAR